MFYNDLTRYRRSTTDNSLRPGGGYGRIEITDIHLLHLSQRMGVLSGQSPHPLDHKLRVYRGLNGPEVYELLLLLLLLLLLMLLVLLLLQQTFPLKKFY